MAAVGLGAVLVSLGGCTASHSATPTTVSRPSPRHAPTTTSSPSTSTTVPATTVPVTTPTTPPPPVTAPPTTVPVTTTTESVVAQMAPWYQSALPYLNGALAMAKGNLPPAVVCTDQSFSGKPQPPLPPVASAVTPWMDVVAGFDGGEAGCQRMVADAESGQPITKAIVSSIQSSWQQEVQFVTSFEATYG